MNGVYKGHESADAIRSVVRAKICPVRNPLDGFGMKAGVGMKAGFGMVAGVSIKAGSSMIVGGSMLAGVSMKDGVPWMG